MTDHLRHGSLFSGVGGFELGFEAEGFATAFQCEIEPWCRRVLRYNWPSIPLYGDIRVLHGADLPAVDVVTFGSPCQDLSVAGRRAGLEGERSGLFFEAIRILRDLRPRFAVWENVKGALSSNKGRDFGTALDALADSGALDIAYRILDAQWFGVPHRRERVFVVADFRGERAGEILSDPEGLSEPSAPRQAAQEDIAGTLGGGAGARGWACDTDRMTFVPIVLEGSEVATAVRRLTPRECERLMGWPDDHTRWVDNGEVSDSHRYRMCGNGVAAPVARWLAQRMTTVLAQQDASVTAVAV